MKKRHIILAGLLFITPMLLYAGMWQNPQRPNVVVIIVDQWRAQATGYSGDKNAITPNLDRLAERSVNIKNAVSGMPVCTPFRASLMTGKYPLTTGVFMNDVMLDTSQTTIAKVYKNNGYTTGFIGKWHIDGHGRSSYIPKNRRQGFEYWKALECSHNYNQSAYYSGDSDKKLFWEGYDVIAQSNDACQYISGQAKSDRPFTLFLSLGPPHDPYHSAPEKYRKMYENKSMEINPNVPAENREKVKKDLIGYYSHMSAIDEYIGKIWQTIQDAGIEKNTILVFTADHGDLLGAHGSWNKQQPYAESIRVPFLIHYPAVFGNGPKTSSILLNSPDIMPTLLSLSGLSIPPSVEGVDFSEVLKGTKKDQVTHTLISCVQPFGQWNRGKGGREYRGIVTTQYTYVKDLKGAWLLFDNIKDPFQLTNLIGNPAHAQTQKKLEKMLTETLKQRKDEFRPGMEYVKKWKYVVDETETVPYQTVNYEGKKIVE
ncbi:sulfatase [Rhodocytophaga aerolata]|uniref:Sulfatase n=1 Tax=Rhodocytophaga aerolata TaxID=455078 RepID=A0ABT8RFF8_9BACT|nr:sulfatase [Rhodocytophaga aerolata]MDO1449918.1 sulfatase [Rhodocytophaga aerolata]